VLTAPLRQVRDAAYELTREARTELAEVGGELSDALIPDAVSDLAGDAMDFTGEHFTSRKCWSCAPDAGYNEEVPCLPARQRESRRGQQLQAAYLFYGVHYRRFVAGFVLGCAVLLDPMGLFGLKLTHFSDDGRFGLADLESPALAAWREDPGNVSLSPLGACEAVSEHALLEFWRFATCRPADLPACNHRCWRRRRPAPILAPSPPRPHADAVAVVTAPPP
jgi:hypothetical protein